MKYLKTRELWLHILLTAGLAALFGLWFAHTVRNGPAHMPGPPPDRIEQFDKEPPAPPDREPGRRKGPMRPESSILIFGILSVIAANLVVYSYTRRRRQQKAMQQLREENLSRQLETLRYQINPHFFMNTLNNIHALVDIDPEKAKESIEEFSKMMRMVLYEGSEPLIPLAKEMDFMQHFASLMRLRYPESVEISISSTGSTEGVSVPPLVMASFVENAFKHGISYERPSFVRASVKVADGKVIFKCTNSRHPGQPPVQHGIGLQNVRKRLDIQYGSLYTLNIEESSDNYDILLVLPA